MATCFEEHFRLEIAEMTTLCGHESRQMVSTLLAHTVHWGSPMIGELRLLQAGAGLH